MENFGVRVFVEKEKEHGYIVRRLDAHSYQVWLDSGFEVIISPNEFVEIEKEKINE